jgi:hypothetical protein
MRLLTLLVTAGLLFAQDKPAEKTPERQEAEIIQVKTLTGDSFNRLMSLLNVFGVKYRGDDQLRTIVVYGPKDVVAEMRRVVEQLDRPGSEAALGKNIDMTLTLLRCSQKPATTAESLPPDIEPVARQLREATQYKDIRLWDVISLRLQEGKDASENMLLPGAIAAGQSATASIVMHPEAVYRKNQGRYVRFLRMELNFRIPVASGVNNQQFTYQDVGMKTSGEFMEGQKTVLGKISGIGADDALFAVITFKVID